MNRMTELLERINYDLPGLKKAKMCYAQGDADGAMDAVIEHLDVYKRQGGVRSVAGYSKPLQSLLLKAEGYE